MGGLSITTGVISAATAAGTLLLRHKLPPIVLLVLGHAIITGTIISAASSDALCNNTAGLLGKDPQTGRFYPGARLLAWPFHLMLNLRITLRRARTTEPLYTQIAEGWYISGWPYKASALPPEEDLAVVDCTCEYPRRHDKPYINLLTWDTQGVSADNVQRAVDWALEQRNLGRAVVVHCAHGHGRSAEVLLGCMIASGRYTSHQEGLLAYQKLRRKCKLNAPQRRNLEEYLAKARAS